GFGRRKSKNTTRPILGHLGHTLRPTENQRRHQQQEQAKARQKARQKAAQTAEEATETEADEAETTVVAKGDKAGAKRRLTGGKALGPFAILREVRVVGDDFPVVGDVVDAGMFTVGERVDLIGTSKGKGFAGVMKRHGFRGGPRTPCQSGRARAPGSIGPGTTPGRVLKGTRMAGCMGNERVTIKSLEIIQADSARNLLLVKGSIPGPNGGLVLIRKGDEQLALAA